MLTYCVVDTETATLPLCESLATNPDEKKVLAIAKPLIYDFGYVITNRKGDILDKKQFLVAEIFSVPSIFNTAYYAAKRPIYLEMLKRGETSIKSWDEIMEIFLADIRNVNAVGAFNSMFDFKKAIPFTELYIRKLYSPDYQAWENLQRQLCINLLNNNKPPRNPNFDPSNFKFRGEEFPLFDIWGLATTYLLNKQTYKTACLNNDLLTNSGIYFKTSAESSYQYLCKNYNFAESHTALDDAIIETFILSKIAAHHAVATGIKYFPFRDLGETVDFVMRLKKPKLTDCQKVYDSICKYIDAQTEMTNYTIGLIKKVQKLAAYAGFTCPY